MAGSVGSIIFVVVVVGGMGSLGLSGLAAHRAGADLLPWPWTSRWPGLQLLGMTVTEETFGWPLLKLTISQVAPILPYLFLVLILIFRPKGLLGTRRTDAMTTTIHPPPLVPPFQAPRERGTHRYLEPVCAHPHSLCAAGVHQQPGLTMLSQIGYLIIICLSYNILLGQGRHAQLRPCRVYRTGLVSWRSMP